MKPQPSPRGPSGPPPITRNGLSTPPPSGRPPHRQGLGAQNPGPKGNWPFLSPRFWRGVWREFSRLSWPAPLQILGSTAQALTMVAITSGFLHALDRLGDF